MVHKNWIPTLENHVIIAIVGAKDRLDVLVFEGVEERILPIDCKKHIFHSQPF